MPIFYGEDHITTLHHSQELRLSDLIADCSGLVAGFLGISMMKVVDFVYVFVLRICCCRKPPPPDSESRKKTVSKLSDVVIDIMSDD